MGHAHDHDGHESQEQLGAYGEKVLRWGLWTDIMLTIGKGTAGYVSGSTAIIADAAHSASDIVCDPYCACNSLGFLLSYDFRQQSKFFCRPQHGEVVDDI